MTMTMTMAISCWAMGNGAKLAGIQDSFETHEHRHFKSTYFAPKRHIFATFSHANGNGHESMKALARLTPYSFAGQIGRNTRLLSRRMGMGMNSWQLAAGSMGMGLTYFAQTIFYEHKEEKKRRTPKPAGY